MGSVWFHTTGLEPHSVIAMGPLPKLEIRVQDVDTLLRTVSVIHKALMRAKGKPRLAEGNTRISLHKGCLQYPKDQGCRNNNQQSHKRRGHFDNHMPKKVTDAPSLASSLSW